jgi:hypothetical protein
VVTYSTVASGGGTLTVQVFTDGNPYTDKLIRLIARVYLTEASAGHLLNSCAILAEYVIQNKNNTTTAVTALATSSNPVNSNTVGFALTSRPEVADTAMNTSTAVWTISSNRATLTVTNNGTGSVNADACVIIDTEYIGST